MDLLLSTVIVKTPLLYFNTICFLINKFKKKKEKQNTSSKKSRTNVSVVDENLNEVKALTSNKQNTPSSQKPRKHAVEYAEDKNKRIDCRYKRREGIINDIRNLKLCTEDNTYLEFYKEKANELARFCTSSDIMM